MSEFYGTYNALVVSNDDPEHRGRVVCQIPRVLGDAHSNWCEASVRAYTIPEVGTTVWVQFIDGDETQPIYLATPHTVIDEGAIQGNNLADWAITARKVYSSTHVLYYDF